VRINDDLRKSVAFIGFRTEETFTAKATGFLLLHEGSQNDEHPFFVTAKHVAINLLDTPFTIRFNSSNEGSAFLDIDPIHDGFHWHFHPDDSVDVAVFPMDYDLREVDYRFLTTSMMPTRSSRTIGIGDRTYTIGLFIFMVGGKGNFPVVHSGSIAALASDELIPVKAWDESGSRKMVVAHLVEQQSLGGLSGSPVFVRCSRTVDDNKAVALDNQLYLLGMWQGAWEAPPDDVLALRAGAQVRVPVGMGVVVPAGKIMEVLSAPELKNEIDKAGLRSPHAE
jgi:hypothetical protein